MLQAEPWLYIPAGVSSPAHSMTLKQIVLSASSCCETQPLRESPFSQGPLRNSSLLERIEVLTFFKTVDKYM